MNWIILSLFLVVSLTGCIQTLTGDVYQCDEKLLADVSRALTEQRKK